MVNNPCCIDINHANNVRDYPGRPLGGFAEAKASGIAFLDHKASQGTAFADPAVARRRAAWMGDKTTIRAVDVDGSVLQLAPRFGFYHFNGAGAAADEAAYFLSVVRPLFERGDDLCLDWERIGASGFCQPATWADAFCSAVEDWCGFPIKVYGGDVPREELSEELSSASSALLERFAARRLWFCEYGAFHPSLVPAPWRAAGPFQWQDDGDQYGPGPHAIPGIDGYCDNSTVAGSMTVAQLAAGWGGGAVA